MPASATLLAPLVVSDLSVTRQPVGGPATAPGGVVLASHDRWLRRRWEGPELVLAPW